LGQHSDDAPQQVTGVLALGILEDRKDVQRVDDRSAPMAEPLAMA
jgi:hypothetical protein